MPRNPQEAVVAQAQRVGRTGLLLLVAFVPLVHHSGLYEFSLLPKRLLVQLVLTVIAFFWVANLHTARVSLPRKTACHLPLAVYLLLLMVAFTQAINPVAGLVDIAHQLTFIFLFILVLNTFPREALPNLLRISAGIGILVSVLGILEGRGFDLAWFPVSNGRPSATFAYRNFAASYLVMNIPLAVALWLSGKDLKDIFLGSLSTCLMLVFLAYTRTRGAWLGFAGSVLITLLLVGHARRHWKTPFGISNGLFKTRQSLFIASIPMILAVLLSLIPPRISAQQSRAIDEKKVELLDALSFASTPRADRGRQAMWQNTIQMIQDAPLLGVGPGNWQYVYPRYDGGKLLSSASAPKRPHNDFLWIASELGLMSLAVYLWVLGAVALTVVRTLRQPDRPEYALYSIAFGASLLAMLGHGLVSFPRELAETSFMFWMGMGILALLAPSRARSQKQSRTSPVVLYGLYLIPLLLLLSTWLTYRQAQFDKHYLNALQYHKGNDFRSVLRESNVALKQGAFDHQIYLLQGDGYQAAGMKHRANEAYLEGLHYHPNAIQLLGALGTSYALQENFDKAEYYYKEALAIYPNYYQMYSNLGGVYHKRGNLPEAIRIYQNVIERNPGFIDAYSNLGLAYLETGRYDEAVQTYQNALTHAPGAPVFYYNLGDAYYAKARQDPETLKMALSSYQQFLKTWKGPQTETEHARRRVAEILKRLAIKNP